MSEFSAQDDVATLAGQVLAQLREDLKANRFKPDERLRFDRMKEIYDIGTAPLREALSRLTETGLVVQVGQKGFRVAPATLDDFQDVINTRKFLEVRAAQEAVRHGSEEWEASVVASFHRFSKVCRATPSSEAERALWEERHTDFHRALLSGCPSRWLRQLWSIVFDQAERYRRSVTSVGHWAPSEFEDHKALMDAAVARDADRIADLLNAHIGVSATRVLTQLDGSLEAAQKSAPDAKASKAPTRVTLPPRART